MTTKTTTHAPCRICGHVINRNAAASTTVCENCKRWTKQLGSEQALVDTIAKESAGNAEGITDLEVDAGAPAGGFPHEVYEPDPDMAAAEARLLAEFEKPGALDTPYQAGLRAIRDADAAAVTPPQMDATGDFIAPAEQRRRATKEPRQQASVTIGLRRCKGSATFGIEPHDAPLADFPLQPSRKDGVGVMCKTHWREYTNALRLRAQGAKPAEPTTKVGRADARALAASADNAAFERKHGLGRKAKTPAVDPALAAAAALIQDVDALPADEYVKRVAQDDVQAALAIVAKGHGTGGDVAEDAAAE